MADATPHRLQPDAQAVLEVLALVQRSFAFMEGRIDPPSSMHRLSDDDIRDQCISGEVWVLGDPVVATMFLKERAGWLYLSKLAVDHAMRGQGLARRLVEHAVLRADHMNLRGVELETRVELAENHAAFERMGFVKTGEGMHAGYLRPTYIVMRRSFVKTD